MLAAVQAARETARGIGPRPTVADCDSGGHLLALHRYPQAVLASLGASISPGQASIVVTAVLSDPALQSIAAQRRFLATAPVTTAGAAGVVPALDVALG